MTSPAEHEELDLLLGAYLDGELDPFAARRFEERLANEPELAAACEKLRSLRVTLRSGLAGEVPSDALRRRVEGQFAPRPRDPIRSWRALAASLVVGLLVGGGVMFGILGNQAGMPVRDQVVAAHIRAIMAPQPIDVASSDRHTVKPWFDGKIAFAPVVVDLAADGFPLVGGRIDVVNLEAVPALVYRAGKHLISVVEIPASPISPVVTSVDRGFESVTWGDGKATYWAVSDVSPDEMAAFVKALRAAVPQVPAS